MPTETTTKTKVSTKSITAARVVAATALVLSMGVLGFTAGIAYFKAQSNVYQYNNNSGLQVYAGNSNTNGPVTEGCGFIPNEEGCFADEDCTWECECQESEINGNGNENSIINDNTNTPPENENTPTGNANRSL